MVVVLPLLQPPLELLRPLEDGQVDKEVVGVCCLEPVWERVGPHSPWPISVRVLVLELGGSPVLHGSLPEDSLVLGVARLHVEELKAEPPLSEEVEVLSEAVRGAGMPLEATLPGVMVGSSVGSFI